MVFANENMKRVWPTIREEPPPKRRLKAQDTSSKHLLKWSKEDVASWLRSLGPKFDPFANEFLKQNIKGEDLYDLTKEDFDSQFSDHSNNFGKRRAWRGVLM